MRHDPKPMSESVRDYIRRIASIGGKARAEKLSPERRSEIAANAARARELKRRTPQVWTSPLIRGSEGN